MSKAARRARRANALKAANRRPEQTPFTKQNLRDWLADGDKVVTRAEIFHVVPRLMKLVALEEQRQAFEAMQAAEQETAQANQAAEEEARARRAATKLIDATGRLIDRADAAPMAYPRIVTGEQHGED